MWIALPNNTPNNTWLSNLPGRMHSTLWVAWLCILSLSGCKTLQLPAIDPNGGRIFSGGTTTFVTPHGPGSGYPTTGPVYQAPPEPAKCVHGSPMGANQSGRDCKLCLGKRNSKPENASDMRGRCGELLLTPTRIVAPVGGEVILLSGICGKDGLLVTGEPIEWMLSPESVGQIIEVGDDAKGQKPGIFFASSDPKVEKVDVDFARGRTSREPGMITRGTSRRDDDLPIRKGQTWLSLSSPSEGVSKVTVMAPESDAWDKRRQTATIYWIDASWDFPKPQLVMSGSAATLVTKVLRTDGFAPAEGWIVRYRSLNPEIARFLPSYAEVSEQRVDAYGLAKVDAINMLQPGQIASANGTALIEIEIIRPPESGSNMPDLQIARGTAEVTWNAPDVNLSARGPEFAVAGQPLAYSATVENLGYQPSENTILSMAIPAGMTIQSSSVPPTRQTATALAWEIGPLGPRQAFDVEVQVIPAADLDARIVFEVTHAPSVTKSAVISTLVQKPQLVLSVQPDPSTTQVVIGDVAKFLMKLTNTGNQTISDVNVIVDAKPGLVHVRDGASQVTRRVGFITPGQSLELEVQFVVQREGELGITATAQAINTVLSSSQAFVRGLPATMKRPQVEVELKASTGANAIPVNTESMVDVFVRNVGPIPIRDLVVALKYDPALVPRFASDAFEQNTANQTLFWRVRELPAGTNVKFQVKFLGANPSANAQVIAQVENGDRSVNEMRNVAIPVVALTTGGNVGGTTPAPPTESGGTSPGNLSIPPRTDLLVAIEPVQNRVTLNNQSQYVVRVRNQSTVNQQRVEMVLQLPEGVSVVDFRGQAPGNYAFDDTGRRIEIEPIQTLRSQEEYSYNLYLKHGLVSEGRLTATVRSANSPEPVSAVSYITILPP
jgi:uncharacterized repeat protein (TIGR01451 family)